MDIICRALTVNNSATCVHPLRTPGIDCTVVAPTIAVMNAALEDERDRRKSTMGMGADSAVLLAEAARRVRQAGFEIGNVDSTVIAQAPKLMPWIPAMRAAIAGALSVQPNQVNVKAKTAEKLGPVGQGLAIEARAIALLYR